MNHSVLNVTDADYEMLAAIRINQGIEATASKFQCKRVTTACSGSRPVDIRLSGWERMSAMCHVDACMPDISRYYDV